MDLKRAEEFQDVLTSIVDFPQWNDSPRISLSATLAISSLQFASAVRTLCGATLILGAAATLRSQFEALVRGVWVLYRATDVQVERLSAELSLDAQQASKNIPLVNEMMVDLEAVPQLANLLVSLREFKGSSWGPLNSFVHSGIHAVHWTKHGAPPLLLDMVFRASNGLSLIAFQQVGILTGRSNLQSEVLAASACFGSILPEQRQYL